MSFKNEVELKYVADYGTAKIEADILNSSNYISTDNLIPEKGGKVNSDYLPIKGKVSKYSKGDTLVSNIRPYFKKILFAKEIGGCSNDVIVFKPKLDKIEPQYLYYQLSKDDFFDFMMAGANGTKMPRGNKKSIPTYKILLHPLPTQREIAKILSAYDDLIENNLKRIKLLEEIAQRTYEEWFLKFRVNGEELPMDKTTGLPVGWKIVKLSDVSTRIQSGGTPSRSINSYWENGTMNWFKTKELQDSWLIDSEEKISIDALNNSSAKTFPPNTILMAIYASPTLGRLGLLQKESSCNQAAIGFICKENIVTFQWLYFKLFELRDRFNGIARGAGQQNISGELVKDQTIVLPKYETIKEFTDFVSPIMFQQLNLQKQNQKLKESRDILLPRLMNGTINVE